MKTFHADILTCVSLGLSILSLPIIISTYITSVNWCFKSKKIRKQKDIEIGEKPALRLRLKMSEQRLKNAEINLVNEKTKRRKEVEEVKRKLEEEGKRSWALRKRRSKEREKKGGRRRR